MEPTLLQRFEQLVGQFSLIGDRVFFTPDQFPWVAELEANWQVIRQELEAVLQRVDDLPNYQDISSRQQQITTDNLWKTYFFYAYGFTAQQNCDRCPETAKLIARVPGVKAAFFSILAPHKHIPEHRGKHKGVIRYHLALLVPQPATACRIRIGDQVAHWQEGKSLIFDDTVPHEVWNHTDGYRVVLFLDVARPLRFPFSLLNWIVNQIIGRSPIVQEARVNHTRWEQQFFTHPADTAP